jgi:nickel transport protein
MPSKCVDGHLWRRVRVWGLALLLVLVWTATGLAHRVYIYAWVEGDRIFTESYFGSKRKVKGGLVQVFEPSGKKLLEGRTDDQGIFSFKVPQRSDLRIVLDASMGHRSEFVLRAEELGGRKAQGAEAPAAGPFPKAVERGPEQIRAVVEEALDARLEPLMRELARARKKEGPGLTEVVGGIGYIVGIMGLVMYFRSRKDK